MIFLHIAHQIDIQKRLREKRTCFTVFERFALDTRKRGTMHFVNNGADLGQFLRAVVRSLRIIVSLCAFVQW